MVPLAFQHEGFMAGAKHVLLVDDDTVLRHSLAEQLVQEGPYRVSEAASPAEARAIAEPFAAAIVGLAGDAGETLARDLRRDGFAGPVLLLTGDDAAGGGAVAERIAKPFRFSTLLARLGAHLSHHGDDPVLSIGPYTFRPGAKLLTDGGARRIRLTEKEANILSFLHGAGRTVPRETLLHEVWGYSPAVTTHTLETHIYRLRRKIEQDPGQAKILLTEGGGYRLAS